MTIFEILLNLIETVTELNGLEYISGEAETYFKPCYTATITCLDGVDKLTVKIPTFFQACRYNNIDHVGESTFLALNKKYMSTVSSSLPAKVIKSDMYKLMTICKSDISLVLWLDFIISSNLYNDDRIRSVNNPVERAMVNFGDNFTNEIIFTLVHDHIEKTISRITLNNALEAYNMTDDEKERERIMITRMRFGHPCNIYWYTNSFLNAATASRITNITNWKYLNDDDTFKTVLNNISSGELFTRPYNNKFNHCYKMYEEAFEIIVRTILDLARPSGHKWDIRNADNVQAEVDQDWVQVECSDIINKGLCSTVESARAYLIASKNYDQDINS